MTFAPSETACLFICCQCVVWIWLLAVTEVPFDDPERNTTGWN